MRSTLSFHWKMAVLTFACTWASFQVMSQAPANDNCAGAILLTSATSCNPTTGTFINATKTTVGTPWVTFHTVSNAAVPYQDGTLVVECWGGGGAGGGINNSSDARAGGGGGGAYTYNNNVTITAGNYPIVVGAGGTGGSANGPAGGASRFNGTTVFANGGTGGLQAFTNGAGAGGAGGTGGTFPGGNGSAGLALTRSGAGGGGAGSGGAGGNASGITPGSGGLVDGGIGGAGTTANGSSDGLDGSTLGGGGSGAVRNSLGNRNGGDGASGAVRVSKCGDPNSPDIWYKFVAASTNPTIVISNVDNNLSAQGVSINLLSGTCAGLTHVAASATNTLAASGLTIGTTYFIRITTRTNFASPASGSYTFDICIQDKLPVPLNSIDFSKSYVNITDGNIGGTINQNDILEIRATLVVKAGTITNVSYTDTLKKNAGLIFRDSISTRTNEGKNFATFTVATLDDAGWKTVNGSGDTTIQINIGTGATALLGGTLANTSKPSLFSTTCVIMATYRVRVDTGTVGYGRKINFGGGAFRYNIGVTQYIIAFPKDSLIVYPNLTACSEGVSPGNLIGSANGGNFGTLVTGSSTTGTQNGGAAAINTTYNYETFSSGPNDYYYGIANNTSKINSTAQSSAKPGSTRVFDLWDITGDHTGAANAARGNKPCDPSLPVSATNPCGYMLTVNSSYRTDKVFEYTASGVCTETYYEVSAWFKNLCSRCGCDVNGVSSGNAGYIPTAPGDSSGVRPNIAMQIDGIDYYTTGELVYQGLAGVPTATDTLNNWVRRSFVFKTSATQTSFKVTFRNNAPGGGGNDWAVDDIELRTCYPTMQYAPTNPIVFIGSSLTITDTVRSYYNSYTYYKWQRKPLSGAWADVVPASTGNAVPVFNPLYGQYEYVISYTIPGTATQQVNSGDSYRMVVASNSSNLVNGCNFVPSTTFTLLPTDAVCALADTNYAIAPQSGNIDWNKLDWSLGHVPTCCESAHITYNSSKGTADGVTVDINNDICIINLTLLNTSTTANQVFKTILHPGYNMQMNGNVRLGASGSSSVTDSCIFIARGGGTITVNGNTVVGYPADNAYSIIGGSPDIATAHNYVLKGDSLTFNNKSLTRDKFITVTMNPIKDTAYFVNNTSASPYPNAVTFESFKIGNGVKQSTVIAAGTNGNSFINNRGGALEVTTNAALVLPANYTINALPTYNSSLLLRTNSTLRIGGFSGGTAGSNFPANYTAYTAHPQSSVEYYGGSANAQTVYSMTYGKLELRNGANALGTGRAQKNSIATVSSATSINVNQQTDFTLGTLGSSTQTISSAGLFNVAGGSGLYCNANVISGAGAFTMGNASYLGMGHALGITGGSTLTGNMQMTGGRTFTTTGNYIYNGLVTQVTGNGLPATVNDLTINNPTTVTIAANQTVNGINYLQQGVFDIGSTKINIAGAGTLTSLAGKMKANRGIVQLSGTTGTAQTLAGSWFVNRNISTLVNANTKGITVAATAGDTLLISSALLYGTGTTGSEIKTNNNLTLLSRDTATARFGIMTGNLITGNVTVERYIGTLRKWRHLAWTTTSAQTVRQSWMENNTVPNANALPGYGTIVTDEKATWAANNFDSRSVSGPSVKYYDGTANSYIGIPNTATYQMNSQSSYYNFIRGDRSCTPANSLTAPTILRTTGTLKTGTIAFPITANQFGSVGNPYASAIDLRGLDTAGLTSTFYIWDPKLTGAYGLGAYQTVYRSGSNYVVLPGGGSYGALGSLVDTLESGQAMFVRGRTGGGTLTFKETAKTIGARSMARISNDEAAYALLNLVDPGGNTLVDGCMSAFGPDFNNGVDDEDALKMTNTSENVSFKRNDQLLTIERRRSAQSHDTLFLNLTGVRVHRYSWEIILDNMAVSGRNAYFIDKYLNTSTALNLDNSNAIEFDIINVAGSYAADRFMIVFEQAQLVPVRFTTISAVRNADKTVMVKWNAENEINMQNYKVEYSADGSSFAPIGTVLPTSNNGAGAVYSYADGHATAGVNYYRIRGNSISGQVQYTSIAKVGPLNETPSISIFPNPVFNHTLSARFTNQPSGSYLLSVTNKIGQVIHSETVKIQNSNTTLMIELLNGAPGGYQLKVQDAEGKISAIPFIIR